MLTLSSMMAFRSLQVADVHTLLLHRVTETEGDLTVSQRVVIHGDAVRRTDGILTTIALTDRILLIILADSAYR